MVIDHNSYKYEACSITNEECGGSSCRDCDVAKDNNRGWAREQAKEELERYTKFERQSNIAGTKVMVDVGNVIAKTDLQSLKLLQENSPFFKDNIILYHPDNLKQYAENLKKLRRYNGLGIPNMIWGAKNYPAAFLFGDVVYLIAPRIESE